MEKRGVLKYILITSMILSGSIFDLTELIFNFKFSVWQSYHFIIKDLMTVGLVSIAYDQASYKNLPLKSFLFMLIIWRVSVAIFNATIPEEHTQYFDLVLYSVYLYWIVRVGILFIRGAKTNDQISKIISNRYFNVYLPVSTFRGLLQVLFIPWRNPKYETCMLVSGENLYRVKNDTFIKEKYSQEIVSDLINKAGALIKPVGLPDITKYDKLVGRRANLLFRNCSTLEVK